MSELPDRLRSGQLVVSSTGRKAVVTTTNQKDPVYGEPRYRLRFVDSGVRGNTFYTRDDLASLGCVLDEGEL